MAEFEALKSGSSQDGQALLKEIEGQDRQIKEFQFQNSKLKEEKELLQAQLQKIREANAQIQSSISQIEKQIGSDNLDRLS